MSESAEAKESKSAPSGSDTSGDSKFDGDGVARREPPGRSPSATGSLSSSGSVNGNKKTGKKKPKDKPKRPMSAYNIFFKSKRMRIIEGKEDDPNPEELIRLIESILASTSGGRQTRVRSKPHRKISFGDLAKRMAEDWKSLSPQDKAIYEHYAEVDMRRYRKEVKIWKEKKEQEAPARQSAMEANMNNSFSSLDSESDASAPFEIYLSSGNSTDAWAPRNMYDTMNSSISSHGSIDSEGSLGPAPLGGFQSFGGPTLHGSLPNLSYDGGMPGFAALQGNVNPNMMNPPMAVYGQHSMSDVQFNPQPTVQMNAMAPQGLMGAAQPPQSTAELQQLRQQNTLQQQRIMEQERLLQRQQELLREQMRQPAMNPMQQQQAPVMPDPLPLDPNVAPELANDIANLDLSNF